MQAMVLERAGGGLLVRSTRLVPEALSRVGHSVANLTRQDAREFLALASTFRIDTHTVRYALADANRALDDLRAGRVQGAAVLVPSA